MSTLTSQPAAERGRNGKTALLIAQLRDEIARGARLPGQQLPSFAEMRRLHGVAPLTTDKIYGQLERDGLIVRENGRGVFVREQKRARTGIIGFSGASASDTDGKRSGYYGQLIEGVQSQAAVAGYEVLLLNPNSNLSWDKMDGLLVSQGFSAEVMNGLPPGMPFVSMVMEWQGAPSVLSADYAATRALTRHLLELGHRRIAIISAGTQNYSQERYQAYLDALTEAGVTVEPEWRRHLGVNSRKKGFDALGYDLMQEWLAEDFRGLGCTAVMAYNDDTACGVIRALREEGLAVPGQVSVTGFDGIPTPQEPLRLTTAHVQLHQIGAQAFEDLHRWMEQDIRPESSKLTASFSAGQTTAVPGT